MDGYLFSLEPVRNGTRGVDDPAVVNLTQVILHGARRQSQLGEHFMPAFGKGYSDAEIVALVTYVSGRFLREGSDDHTRSSDQASRERGTQEPY